MHKEAKALKVSYTNKRYNITYNGHTSTHCSYIDAKAHIDAIMCSMRLQEAQTGLGETQGNV
jgi:hypothetical protein